MRPLRLAGPILFLLAAVAGYGWAVAGEMDLDEDALLALEEDDGLGEAEVLERLRAAVAETDAARRGPRLLAALQLVLDHPDVVTPPREWRQFAGALMDQAPREELRALVPQLLAAKEEGPDINLQARAHMNLGIQLSLTCGGAAFVELKGILRRHREVADLEWLLPALGRTGGREAIPLIQPFCKGLPAAEPGNVQKVRRPVYAAVLGCAYAGDAMARETILGWYEQDYVSRPTHAWNVQWARKEGLKFSYATLDQCQHRIAQAERLLDFLGPEELPRLVDRCNEAMSLSLTAYLSQRVRTAPIGQLAHLDVVFEHPSILLRHQLLTRCIEAGDSALRDQVRHRIDGLTRAERSLDRCFAAQALILLDRQKAATVLPRLVHAEPDGALRRRLAALAQHTTLGGD